MAATDWDARTLQQLIPGLDFAKAKHMLMAHGSVDAAATAYFDAAQRTTASDDAQPDGAGKSTVGGAASEAAGGGKHSGTQTAGRAPPPAWQESTRPPNVQDARVQTLHDTLSRLRKPKDRENAHATARLNLGNAVRDQSSPCVLKGVATLEKSLLSVLKPKLTHRKGSETHADSVYLYKGDWGVLAQALTFVHGKTFAVLNMANAYSRGGGYWYGAGAQEENMWRRSDCHFEDEPTGLKPAGQYPRDHMLQSGHAVLYTRPRVCIKGAEAGDGTYPLLPEHEMFEFFELRSAAVDTNGVPYSFVQSGGYEIQTRKRIREQLGSCRAAGVQHVLLSAFGCGAFMNNSWSYQERRDAIKLVAMIYADEIDAQRGYFQVVAFAIHYAGYGEDNAAIFSEAWSELHALRETSQARGDLVNGTMWFWADQKPQGTTWVPYDPDTASKLELASQRRILVTPDHVVDLVVGLQYRIADPSKLRQVRRIEPSQWSWQNGPEWVPYGQDVSSRLEQGWSQNVIISAAHTVDLLKMVQRRRDDPSRFRRVRRAVRAGFLRTTAV